MCSVGEFSECEYNDGEIDEEVDDDGTDCRKKKRWIRRMIQ